MSLPFNPISLAKLIFDGRRQKKEDFVEFMNIVAQQASALALIWEKAVDAIESPSLSSLNRDEIYAELRKWRTMNWPIFYELEEFYRSFSSVTVGYIPNKDMESIVNHISRLLMQRNLTKEMYEKHFSRLTSAVLVNDENKIEDFSDLHASVQALQKEAAALQAIAKSAKLAFGGP